MQERKVKSLNASVISRSGDKSIKVLVEYKIKHPKYGKYMKRRTKLGVHDELNEANVGDTVEIIECRPMSKTKNCRLSRILNKAIVD